MGRCIVRDIVVTCIMLGLVACSGAPIETRLASVADSENGRAVEGKAVTPAQLTPEPGDIWTDLAFLKQQPSAPTQEAPPLRPIARPAGKSFSVQLIAASSEDAARNEWRHLQQRIPDLVGGRLSSVVQAEVKGRLLWRLRTGDFATLAEATTFCGLLQSKQAQCWVVASSS